MGFTLAKTVFSTKADEALAAIDLYAKNDSGVVNSSVDNAEISSSSISGLKVTNLADGIQLATTNAAEGFKKTESLLSEIGGLSSSLQNTLNALPANLQANLLKNPALANVQGMVNGVATQFNAGLSTISGVSALVSGISGIGYQLTSLVNPNALAALGANLVKEGIKLGMPDIYATFSAGVNNLGVMAGMTQQLLPTMISSSNLNLLSNIANGVMSGNVKNMMPSIIGDFSRQFTLPNNAGFSDYNRILNNVDSSFNQFDTNWKSLPGAGGDSLINMNDLNSCSRDMTSLLQANASGLTPNVSEIADYATMNTSAIPNELSQVAVMKGVTDMTVPSSNTTRSPDPLNRDMEFIGLFGSIPNPNYAPPRTSSVISTSTYNQQTTAGYSSGAIVFDEAPASSTVEANLNRDFPAVARRDR